MNDNELFELCREVFEKTGLEGDGDTNYEMQYGIAHYTSDYLLEKLPTTIWSTYGLLVFPDGKTWCAMYTDPDGLVGVEVNQLARCDTPLKALLKLTLALHEAGELK